MSVDRNPMFVDLNLCVGQGQFNKNYFPLQWMFRTSWNLSDIVCVRIVPDHNLCYSQGHLSDNYMSYHCILRT